MRRLTVENPSHIPKAYGFVILLFVFQRVSMSGMMEKLAEKNPRKFG